MMKKLFMLLLCLTASWTASAEVVLIGNPANAQALNKAQAKSIFLGKTKKLPGGILAAIHEYPSENPLKKTFHKKVTGKSVSQLKSYWSRLVFTGKAKAPVEVANATAMKAAIAAKPGAVGYLDEADLDDSVVVLFKP